MANPDLITITATIYQDEWHSYSGYLEEGQQAIVELTLTDPYDYEPFGIDPDVYVYSPDWSYQWMSAGPYDPDNPNPAELMGFEAPMDGWYHLYIHGWWIPPEGAEYTLTVEYGYDVISWTVEPCGVKMGALRSFAHCAWNAKAHANEKSAIYDGWYPTYAKAVINEFTTTTPDMYYRPPSATFSTEDNLAVGGLYFAAYTDEYTPEEARDLVANTYYKRFLRRMGSDTWIPLEDLTKVTTGPVKPDYDHGVLFRYSRLCEIGYFHPGELAEKLGGHGEFEYRSEIYRYGSFLFETYRTFWLLPPP
jgi:hypothetical protein